MFHRFKKGHSMKKIFFIFMIIVLALEVKAYPIFFKCDAQGAVSNILQPAELTTQLKGLADASLKRPNMTTKTAAQEACRDAHHCMKELVQLTGIIRKAGQLNRDELIQKIEAKAKKLNEQIAKQGVIQISESDHSELVDLNRANVMSYSCREITNEIDPKNFQDEDRCVLGNFHHSPYMSLYPNQHLKNQNQYS